MDTRATRSNRRTRAWVLGFLLPWGAACAGPGFAGRWEGQAEIPGAPQRFVVDLAPASGGGWDGSVVLPGRGVKGAPLGALRVDERGISFGLAAAFSAPTDPPPTMELAPRADGTLAGTLRLAGLDAAVELRRTGEAQVDRPHRSAHITDALAGTWRGRYEFGGYAREVTLTLANRPDAAAGGQITVVGKRTTTLDIDLVDESPEYVALRASAADYRIEGRFDRDACKVEGAVIQGPFETPIVLHHPCGNEEKHS